MIYYYNLLSWNAGGLLVVHYSTMVDHFRLFYTFRFRLDADGSSLRLLTISLGTKGKFSSLDRFTMNSSRLAPDLRKKAHKIHKCHEHRAL